MMQSKALTNSQIPAAGPSNLKSAETLYCQPLKQGLYDPGNEHDSCGVGFIAQMKGIPSHQIIIDGLQILENMTHRGAVGADPLMGDGAGILVQIPHEFFSGEQSGVNFDIPESGEYAVGHIFLPGNETIRKHIEKIVTTVCKEEGLAMLGWRDVP
ncbi:MAG: hypothetical protein GY761_06415, partial [Hyphomicrobiales bacterium]|nr:hypothetical protein [Hyphomicrobiales bacterium]